MDIISTSMFIRIVHIIVVLLVVFVPFLGNKEALKWYIVYIPFVVAHWILNDDTCILTLLEAYVSGKQNHETFVGQLIGPVYKVTDRMVYAVVFVLYCIAQVRYGKTLFGVYGDLFRKHEDSDNNDRYTH